MRAWIVDENDVDRFRETTLERPAPAGRDLLVKVEAVALNPVDTKVRKSRPGKVLGWDASGTIVAVGDAVRGFAVGDEVYYAGDIGRAGSNAQYQLVDERIVGRKPRSLSHLEAAALPLTALTAWEGLYEQLRVREGASLLVINAAGGVGSLAVQMAKRLSRMAVIGTASRPESVTWVRGLGADHTIDHRGDMPAQLRALGRQHVDYILCCHGTDAHFAAMCEMLAPQGHICSIVGATGPLEIGKLMQKKASFSWELMFTKAIFQTPDMDSQRAILDRVAALIDDQTLRCTLKQDGDVLTAEGLTEAHRRQAASEMIGKIAFRVPHE
jgi:zinc-binding alcohol dehydrogenase family protein